MLDFIADQRAVARVQRVMFGALPETDLDVTAFRSENACLAEALRDTRVAFAFLRAIWLGVITAQAGARHSPRSACRGCGRGRRPSRRSSQRTESATMAERARLSTESVSEKLTVAAAVLLQMAT
ncbi:hypothetical protein [Paraburkholderia sacchari]|uniref:hypothetical protein n=1 Tax=Paraburkholderia sacchari TaxID=159450 RepID=UPI00054345C1|nr:hypothetical protein [Paraburkholderia sacchari]NLP64803.1 hypothetical protein [Paraburkholderia sacchari]